MPETTSDTMLAPMPSDWERCLAIVAHPDDMEYGASSPFATHAVDITDTLERGIASLVAHRVYLEGLGEGPMSDPAAFLRTFAEQAASEFNGRLATSFELLEMSS